MAKSKSGGSRAYLRGRIANDVYSIGKDGKGRKQQVVRGLAETVSNPRTTAQMRQRMILSGVSMLAKGLRPYVDHSFDGIDVGVPSVSEFERRAIRAYGEDAMRETPLFGYLPYGVKTYPSGMVQISQGKVKQPFELLNCIGNSYHEGYGKYAFSVEFPGEVLDGTDEVSHTMGDFIDLMFSGSTQNYVTFIVLIAGTAASADALVPDVIEPQVRAYRLKVKDGVDRSLPLVEITNPLQYFESPDGVLASVNWVDGSFAEAGKYFSFVCAFDSFSPSAFPISAACGVISSVKNGGKWIHSTSYLDNRNYIGVGEGAHNWGKPVARRVMANEADALMSYPTGVEKFLNGGSL